MLPNMGCRVKFATANRKAVKAYQVEKLSLREAAKAFDVSRPTLQKAIKSGKISADQNSEGHWQVDPSELARVYKPRPLEHGQEQVKLTAANTSSEIKNTPEQAEIERLKAELAEAKKAQAVAEALADERLERIKDMKALTDQRQPQEIRFRWPWQK